MAQVGPEEDGDSAAAEALAMLGLAKKLEEQYPPIVDGPLLARLSQDVHKLLLSTTNARLRKGLEEGLVGDKFGWGGSGFLVQAIESRPLARLLDRIADAGNGASFSKTPIRQECLEPGKASWMIWRVNFEIDDTYQPLKAVGKGAYGVVCSARHSQTGTKVAIKRIGNAFVNVTDARRTLREIKLLRHLRHDNIIGLKDIMRTPPKDRFTDVYLVYELMDTDLHQIIRSSQALSNEHLQYFTYQILRGLKYIHSANVLHRDLKPGNLLLNSSCNLKICDFGLARTSSEKYFMTEYVVTRWYRAPELLLSCDSYGPAIDVWSVGCILAELLGRKPIFPGKDYVDQLKLIMRGLGQPNEADLLFISSQKARQYIQQLPSNVGEKINFRTKFPEADPLAIDLLERMLCFDPRQRITVGQALQHPWLETLHDDEKEPVAPGQFSFDFEETQQLTEHLVRDLVWEEIRSYHQ